jgi:hypothetical protein
MVDSIHMVHPVEEALERADTMLENGHPERAINTLELALFKFSEDARLVVRLSELYAMQGEDEASASYYLQAMRLDPADPELQARMSGVLDAVREAVEKLAAGSAELPPLRRRKSLDVPRIDLENLDLPEEVLSLVPRDLVVRFRVVPVAISGQTLLLATSHPENRRALEEIGFVTGYAVNCALATDEEINSALQRYYGVKSRKKR